MLSFCLLISMELILNTKLQLIVFAFLRYEQFHKCLVKKNSYHCNCRRTLINAVFKRLKAQSYPMTSILQEVL